MVQVKHMLRLFLHFGDNKTCRDFYLLSQKKLRYLQPEIVTEDKLFIFVFVRRPNSRVFSKARSPVYRRDCGGERAGRTSGVSYNSKARKEISWMKAAIG